MVLTARIALIDMTGHIENAELARVAAAIDVQVTRDLAAFWPVQATVGTLPSPVAVPPGVWPVFIVSQVGQSMAGFHRSVHNQPYAEVADSPCWSLAASHEILEMITDPSGNRLVAADAIGLVEGEVRDVPGAFEYLLEICDPSEDPDFAYLIDGVAVADFYTPSFFDSKPVCGGRYSFTGSIRAPRRVLPGGYLSWWDAGSGTMHRLDHVERGERPRIIEVGLHPVHASLREFADGALRGRINLSAPPAGHWILERRQRATATLSESAAGNAAHFRRRR